MVKPEENTELIDVVNKLTDPTDPVGETYADDIRYENLQKMIGLMKALHMQIDEIATNNKNRQEFGISCTRKFVDKYFD